MARVHLHSGGVSPGRVRLDPRGASERLRPPGDDVNSPGPGRAPACGWCGGTDKVRPDSRPLRCGPCAADEAVVAQVSAGLARAKLPPLGRPGKPGQGGVKARNKGEQARARLAARRQTKLADTRAAAPAKAAGKAKPASTRQAAPAKQPSSRRRLTPAQKAAALKRLTARVEQMERELRQAGLAPSQQDRLREDLGAARTLLRAWDDDIH